MDEHLPKLSKKKEAELIKQDLKILADKLTEQGIIGVVLDLPHNSLQICSELLNEANMAFIVDVLEDYSFKINSIKASLLEERSVFVVYISPIYLS
jgi:hypothetical protein